MSNEEGSEDRLTKGEFAELIQHLAVQEILSIEYRIGTNWSKLFSRKCTSTQIFVCNLCVLEASSFKNLLAHIDGRKHKLQMERVKQLYHPDYTYPKNDKKELNENPSNKKPVENATASVSTKSEPNAPIQPTVVADNDKEKLENKTLQSKAKNRMSIGKSDSNLDGNNIVVKPSAVTLLIGVDKKTVLSTGQAECSRKQNEEESISLCNVTSFKGEVENSEVISKKQDSDKNKSAKDSEEETIRSKKNLKETKKITAGVPKRRPDNETEGGKEVKKAKIVINPAAALSVKAVSVKTKGGKDGDGDKGKPQYQTDKIIIPTVHKSKSHIDKTSSPSTLTSQSQNNGQPKFSVKSYSSNPSDNDVYGILGVEYVIKILKTRNDLSPRYECGLCELVLDGFAMQRHLEGYNHRLKFCEKHFPTAIRHYRQYMENVPEPELFKVMTPVLAKLAVAIEQHHGRNLPYECYERDFSLNRHEILAKAFSCRHASEQYGPTFTHVVGSKEIDELINNRHKYLPPSSSRNAIFDTKTSGSSSKSDIHQQNFKTANKLPNSRDRHRYAARENVDTMYISSALYENIYPSSNFYGQVDNRNVAQHVDDETYNLMVDDFLKGTLRGISGNVRSLDHRKRSISPVRNFSSVKRKSLSPLRQNDIWQAYRHMVDQELYSLDERFKQYRKDPETHPSYNEEWQTFWKRRKDELVSAGLDHRKYNYQPEWVRFIKIRIEELYGQEVENVKIKSRERLCLPLTNENISDVKYHVQAPKIASSNETIATPNSTDATISLSTNILTCLPSSTESTPQVVSVLRLMTALEDSLGSLGPKIIDLLSKALQAEKTNPSHVNAIILNDDNCSLIETAKEKFKGLVITGLFEGSKKRVLKQVVIDTEELLKYAYKFRQLLASQRSSLESSVNRTQNNMSFSTNGASATVSSTLKHAQCERTNSLVRKTQMPSMSTTENLLTRVDKKELASKLAASLVAQGKTDFDPQQLQQLIAVYKLIEKKKRESAGTVLSNKESTSSKKTLSDTLSDLLKSSSSTYTNLNAPGSCNTSQSTQGLSNQILVGRQFSSNATDIFQPNNLSNSAAAGNCDPSNSFTSVLQNSSDNYFNNTAPSMPNVYSGGKRNQLEQQHSVYANNLLPHQQNSSMGTVQYNNQYPNNNRMMTQSWRWDSNMGMNQNYNMGEPNNNYNRTSNWQNY